MPTSTRFAVAVQALAALALQPETPLTSAELAASVRTNPTVIRRILGLLGEAGLTTSQLGQGGGALLARPAGKITLLDVYRAVEQPELFALPKRAPNGQCVVGCHIWRLLCARMDRAQCAMEGELAGTTIAEIAAEIAEYLPE